MALTDTEQKQVHTQTMNISAATSRSEQRERDMLTILSQQNDLLYSILESVNNLNPGN